MRPNFTGDWPHLGGRIYKMPTLIASGLILLSNAIGFSPFAVAILGEGGFVAAVGSAVSLGLAAGASIGLSLLTQKKPAAPQPSDVQSNIRQEISARRRLYSRYLTGSIIVFGFRRGEKSYILHYICEGPIEGFVSFRLDKKPVTLDEAGFVTDDQYNVDGRSRVQILTTLGLDDDEPFDEILAAFPELDTPLTPFRNRGCAMALQIVEQVPAEQIQTVYPNNMPGLQFVIDGLNDIYDPRDESTGLSGNAGLCALAEIMDVFGLTAADTEDIAFDTFAAFADRCDEDVALNAGGTEKRYRCAGPISLDAENESRIQSIATVCNAEVYIDAQGRFAIREKMQSAPGIALRARNGDHLSIQLEGGRPLQKRFNTAKVAYVDPDLNWKANEVRWRHPDLYADDGEELPANVQASLCPSGTQAQRIAKLAVNESNPDFVGSLTSGPQALDLVENYVFTLDLSPEDDFERVAAASGVVEYDAEQMTVSTDIVIFTEGATDWDETVDEQDQVIVPPVLTSNVDDVTLDVTVTVALLENSAPILKFSWVASGAGTLPDSYSQQVQVSPADADDWHDATVNQPNDTAQYGPVADGGAYDWQIRNIAAGKTFDWQSSTSPVTVTVDPVAPGPPTSLSVNVVDGIAVVTFRSPNSANFRAARVWRAPAAGSFGTATDVSGPLYFAPNTLFSYVDDQDIPASGSYKWWVTAENISAIASTETGPVTATAGLDAATLAYVAAMAVEPPTDRKIVIDQLVAALKAASIWTKFDFLYLLAAHDEQASRVNLVAPATYTLAASNVPTFTADTGYAGNGTNAWLSAGVAWNALTLCTQNDQHMGFWIVGGTDAAATKYAMGQGGGTSVQSLRPRSASGDIRALIASSGTSTLGSVGTIIGHTVAVRTGATAATGYRNGASTGTSATASTARSTGTVSLFRDGSVYSDFQLAFAHGGASLSGTDMTALYAALDAYLTAIA